MWEDSYISRSNLNDVVRGSPITMLSSPKFNHGVRKRSVTEDGHRTIL